VQLQSVKLQHQKALAHTQPVQLVMVQLVLQFEDNLKTQMKYDENIDYGIHYKP